MSLLVAYLLVCCYIYWLWWNKKF